MMTIRPTIHLTDCGVSLDNISPLMSAGEVAQFLNISEGQFRHFRTRHNVNPIAGLNKYSIVPILRIIAGAPDSIQAQGRDPIMDKIDKIGA